MKAPATPDLAALLPSWELHLRAERKSPQTLKTYGAGVRRFLQWCQDTGTPPVLSKATVNGFTVALLDGGASPSTAVARQLGVRRFSAWLTDEGEQATDPLLGMKAPKLDSKVIEPLTDDQLRALVKACAGNDYRDRRDEALVRFMVETTARAGEVLALQVGDVDLTKGIAVIRRGKGGKGRIVPIGPTTCRALDRWLRARRQHRRAEATTDLWLGDRNRGFSYDALRHALLGRARAAGIDGFHLHLTRHTAANRWLAAGGSEGGLMAIAGWSSADMMTRYTKARSSERAAAEARSLGLGDL